MNTDYSKIKGKRVLLFSGGMDCYIINALEQPDVLLFIDNKSKYSTIERSKLEARQAAGLLPNLVIVEDFINMSELERDDYIIPSRNAYFILRAAEFGDEIILGATSGDRSTDKDKKFAKMMTNMLNHIYESSHWVGSEGRNIKVNFKYKNYTKQQLIKALIRKRMEEFEFTRREARKYVAKELFKKSASCYEFVGEDDNYVPCGTCKPCTRKWLAILAATGIDTGEYFATNPRGYFSPDVIEQWIAKESGPNNRGKESKEIIKTLERIRDGKL